MANLFRSLIWALFLWIGSSIGPVSGLVIYRFGGADLAPPPEANGEGVEFIQLDWMDLEAGRGGQAIDLDADMAGIRAPKRDPNFNIAPGIEAQGGSHLRATVNGQVWDGDEASYWVAEKYLCAEFRSRGSCTDEFGRQGTTNIFLGSLYRIDRIRVISGLLNPSKTARTLRIHIGAMPQVLSFNLSPEPFSPWIVEVRDNREQILDISVPAHEEVEFVQVTLGEHNEDWEVHEIEIFAKGFVQKASYISNILDFGQPMAWGDLRWSGRQDPKAQVLVQTRSGVDDDPVLFWRFTGRGGEKALVSRPAYQDLKVGEKAGTGYDRSNWTFWSAPYAFADSAGAPVVSLSPRRYFQLKVDFLPRDEDSGQIDFLELRASEPVATNLLGEVWPIEATVGQTHRFTYALRPTLRAGDGGFDRLEIATSSIMGAVGSVRIGGTSVAYEVAVEEPHRLVVGLPRLEARDSGTLVEVEFDAQVLRYGSTFDARVWDSAKPLEVPQGVNAGDATAAFEGNRVSVATAAAERELLQVRVESALFTPNGDGRNDGVRIGYDLIELTGRLRVEVEVWDVSGRRVRRVYVGMDGIGSYERVWDGRDEAGRLVPPGIYLYRVAVDTDREKIERAGVLYAAY